MNYMYINENGDWACQYCCTSALMYESVSHLPDCPVVCDSDLFCCEHQCPKNLVDYDDGSHYECPECKREDGEALGLR